MEVREQVGVPRAPPNGRMMGALEQGGHLGG